MKKLYTLLVVSLLVTGLRAQSWNLHTQFSNFEPADMMFLDDNHGFIFGDSTQNGTFITSLCLVTNDGGATWAHHSLNSTSNRVVKGHFINAQEGFVAGRGSGGNSG
ncbi:MAG: hypothetical protein JNL88_03025, partial [Bacteroidia bacterium]|nr:hypothetical protein [Bacteroidia bacterium]